jgi:hypothetical protein
MLTKKLFFSQQNFIDHLFSLQPEGVLTNHFGIEFRGLDEITKDENDDGEFAGPQFYILHRDGINFIDNFPKEFPCVISIFADEYGAYSVSVYPSDFKI